MIKLSEDEKKFIKELNHPTYTAEWVEEWANRNDNVFVNAPAALQAMGAKGFCEAVRILISMPEYERLKDLKERDRAKKPKGISVNEDLMRVGNCPNCRKFLTDRYDTHHCECGQRIDWEEEDER